MFKNINMADLQWQVVHTEWTIQSSGAVHVKHVLGTLLYLQISGSKVECGPQGVPDAVAYSGVWNTSETNISIGKLSGDCTMRFVYFCDVFHLFLQLTKARKVKCRQFCLQDCWNSLPLILKAKMFSFERVRFLCRDFKSLSLAELTKRNSFLQW
jgi:hypothetical protein